VSGAIVLPSRPDKATLKIAIFVFLIYRGVSVFGAIFASFQRVGAFALLACDDYFVCRQAPAPMTGSVERPYWPRESRAAPLLCLLCLSARIIGIDDAHFVFSFWGHPATIKVARGIEVDRRENEIGHYQSCSREQHAHGILQSRINISALMGWL